jgi:hypothetical protein
MNLPRNSTTTCEDSAGGVNNSEPVSLIVCGIRGNCSFALKDEGLGEGSQVFQQKHVVGPDHGVIIQTAQDNNTVI